MTYYPYNNNNNNNDNSNNNNRSIAELYIRYLPIIFI